MNASPRESLEALRRDFGYPKAVIRALDETLDALAVLEPHAVVLMGSAGRGELTWRETSRGLELLSDFELACFGGRMAPTAVAAVRRNIREIQRRTAIDNGLFHIDVMIAKHFPRGRYARGLLWYEAALSHRLLLGRLRPSDFGDVRSERVSVELLSELVIIRLFWMLVHLPARLLERQTASLTQEENERLVYVQVRNLLDVASIWLPHEGVFELGYRARADHVRRHWTALGGRHYLPAEFPQWLEDATRKKLGCDLAGDPIEWYTRAVRSYRGLTAFLLDSPADSALADEAGARWAEAHPAPRSWRFRAYRASYVLREAMRLPRGPRWLARRQEPSGSGLAFLLRMHEAAWFRLADRNAEAEAALAGAAAARSRFAPVRSEKGTGATSFARRWHALRNGFVDPFIAHYRKLRGQHSSIREILGKESPS